MCMTPGCDGAVYSRGLCRRCYNRLHRRVVRGTTKWGDLISEGQCTRAKTQRGRTPATRRAEFFNKSTGVSRKDNLDYLLGLGRITQSEYDELIKKVD